MIFKLFLFFIVSCHGKKFAIFYENKPPVYFETNETDSSHRAKRDININTNLNFEIFIYHQALSTYDLDLVANKINQSLNILINGWKKDFSFNLLTSYKYVSTSTNCKLFSNEVLNIYTMHFFTPSACIMNDNSILGQGAVGGSDMWIYPSKYQYEPMLIAHELGHNFGLLHASYRGNEYGDPSCVMGDTTRKKYIGGYLNLNAPHKLMLGWYKPKYVFANTTNEIFSMNHTIYTVEDIFYFDYLNYQIYIYQRNYVENTFDTKLIFILSEGEYTTHVQKFQFFFKKNHTGKYLQIFNHEKYPNYPPEILYFPIFLFLGIFWIFFFFSC